MKPDHTIEILQHLIHNSPRVERIETIPTFDGVKSTIIDLHASDKEVTHYEVIVRPLK